MLWEYRKKRKRESIGMCNSYCEYYHYYCLTCFISCRKEAFTAESLRVVVNAAAAAGCWGNDNNSGIVYGNVSAKE